MENVNLKLAQFFVLSAERGSFRKAAEALGRSPSAVSMKIKELEEQLGVQLFLRVRQRIQLTKDGRELYETIRSSVETIDRGFASAKRRAGHRRGHVAFACAPTLAAQGVGQVLRPYLQRYPESVLCVKEAPPDEGARLLRDTRVEFYIGPKASEVDDFEYKPLLRDRLVACIPKVFDDGKDELSFIGILDRPLIVLDKKTSIRQLIDRLAHSRGVKLKVLFEIDNAYTGLALAELGIGVALLPRIAVGMGRFEKFRTVPITDEDAARTVGITRLKGHVFHNYSDKLVELIEAAYAQDDYRCEPRFWQNRPR